MKRFFLVSLATLTLSACETLPDISMPDFSLLNPFESAPEQEPVTQVTMPDNEEKPTQAVTPESNSALSTELSEIEHLTGNTPLVDPYKETVIEEVMTEVTEEVVAEKASSAPEKIVKEIPQSPEPVKKPAPEKIKPIAQEQKTEPVLKEPIEVLETPPSLKNKAQETKQPEPTPVQEIPVEPISAIPPSTVNEKAMFTEQDLKLSSAKGCPTVEIMPAGRSITYFENEISGQLVARSVINEIRGGCEYVSGGLEVDLDILMFGKITDKGRFEGRKDMEAFMTFPYFVAISDPQGLPVDKKIMATAMRFKPVINELNHAEKITQFIPMENTNEASNYKIMVGFQLTRKQLEYNRARTVHQLRIDPDRRKSPRVSTNPLLD